jgi:hypothetical protein
MIMVTTTIVTIIEHVITQQGKTLTIIVHLQRVVLLCVHHLVAFLVITVLQIQAIYIAEVPITAWDIIEQTATVV